MGIRFDDTSHLEKWRKEGAFPRIHDDIYTLVMQTIEAKSIVDMCCSIGLLGTRLKYSLKIDVIGVEGKHASILRASDYEIPIPIFELWMDRSTISAFVDLIESKKITGIVARRCLSELFGNTPDETVDWEWAEIWCNAVAEAGVNEIWIEGRADQGRSVHPIPDTKTEIACLASRFEVAETYRSCAYLKAKI